MGGFHLRGRSGELNEKDINHVLSVADDVMRQRSR